ncbi:hypothetical protein N7489_006260 [Penicillium chrysogenum]|uniref:uncharacterized protein n=1 Tax=Penicillium chrysogenum TaxID=5076 RepID=UPI0024DF20F1|nr:uncharacterized protein N7489_006260 [Penicillium chrysogenum]KAJ5236169.1 hypothetical protein N7489_006260 [Penicillium chrysogenum]
MRKSRQTSKTMNIEIQDGSEWVNDRVWAKEVQFDPGSGEREGEDKSTECTQYYERRQHLAPITGPAAKPRVQKPKRAKKKDPFSP